MTYRLFALCTPLAILVACAPPQADRDEGSEREERSGHEVVAGNCSINACGGQSETDACWCDDLCESYNDCCADKTFICPGLGEQCGGLVGIPCADGFCADNPNDSCDPQNGGADCGGLCVEQEPCHSGGCSGQLCIPVSQNLVTTCEWKPEYDCVKQSECGNFGPGGTCAWNETPEYAQCLEDLEGPDGCTSDADCTDGWCRATQNGDPACTPWAQEDDLCAGHVPQWNNEKCAPGLVCYQTGEGAFDIPGTCRPFCGGIAGFPCEPGNHCVLDGNYPDAGGHCEANAPDSCMEQCGGQSEDSSCWCDSLCTNYGDCCGDYANVCI